MLGVNSKKAVGVHHHVAVVTGAGNGIGKAIATALAGAGAKVVVADIQATAGEQTADEIRGRGGQAMAIPTDVADPSSVDKLATRVVETFGQVHILVNNAAVQISKTAVDTTPEEWNRQMAVNVGGVFLCSRRFLPLLRQTRGVIINLSSVNGFFAEPACAGYCATKAAILGLTKAMAIDHGREGVRVHAICPGYIDAGLAESYFESQADPARARAEAGSLHALGRIGRPEEVARVAVFLASEDASFLTGSPIIVDGGFSAGLPPKGK
jgi:NAD(P)-dependent dehydrogenase (short-subunit alcohol dehydrogenase family)